MALLTQERCPGCDQRVAIDAGFCAGCELLLERISGALRPPKTVAAAFVYGGPLADALRSFKYGNRPEIGRVLSKLLATEALCYAGAIDRVMPVPLHPTRLRARGFNQAVTLARAVARELGVPLDTAGLRRLRPTRDQASLPRGQRITNLRSAFAARSVGQRSLRVLLIDDVRTTGSTLSAAARALSVAGYAEVHCLALAQADDGAS